jgi:hypothetical protein
VSKKESILFIKDGDFPTHEESHHSQHYVGHTHFWERAMMSRRRFIGAAAGTTGAILGSALWMPKLALAAGSDPNPIPGGFEVAGKFFHVFNLGEGSEPSSITDFKGFVGVADVQGTGTANYIGTGRHETLNFDTDLRFMQGTYIGMDGNLYSDTFGFI